MGALPLRLKVTALMACAKPRVLALLCLLAFAGATLSPNFLSPLFPETTLASTAPFRWLAKVLPGLFTPALWSLAHALGASLITGLLWAGTALVNDAADTAIDRIANPDRPVVSGQMRREEVLRWAFGLQAAALALTAVQGGLLATILVTGGGLLGSAYSLPPLRLRNDGITANLVIGAGVFMAVIGGSVAQFSVTVDTLVTAGVLGVLSFAASMVKDFKDVEGDAAAGVRTLPVLVGHAAAVRINTALVASAYGGAVAIIASISGWAAILVGLLGCVNIGIVSRLQSDTSSAYRQKAYRMVLLLFMGVTVLYVGAQIVFRP